MTRIDPGKMTKSELDRLGDEAEKIAYRDTRPLTKESRRALQRAADVGGRPRIGAGAKRINITVEANLLKRADRYARKHGLSRAALVAKGLKKIIA